MFRKSIRINGKLISKSFNRKTDADRWYSEQRRQKELVNAGLINSVQPTRLSEYVENWLNSRAIQGKAESTVRTDSQRLRDHVLPSLGNRVLHQISSAEWESLFDGLITRRKVSASTRNRTRTLVHKIYKDAIRQGFALNNPVANVPRLRERVDTYDYFETKEDCNAYLALAYSDHKPFFVFTTLALNTGGRMGEILALRWKDVDLVNRRIHFARTVDSHTKRIAERNKNWKTRWVGISDALFEALMEHKAQTNFNHTEDLVVCEKAREVYCKTKLRRAHNRTCKAANLKLLRIHDLRHTFASHFVMNGGTLADLQAILGHSSPMMTNKYAHLSVNHVVNKANVATFSWKQNNADVVSLTQRVMHK